MGGSKEGIDQRTKKARKAMRMLVRVSVSGSMNKNCNLNLFNSCVKSVLLYECET